MKMRASDVPNNMSKNAKNTNRHTKTLGDIIISKGIVSRIDVIFD
jgi:hypothetical protein